MNITQCGGETEILARLLGPSSGRIAGAAEVVVPNGDDAAVVRIGGHLVAVTTDTVVEGRHFDRRFSSLTEIGAKAIEAAASDIVAMGGYPRQIYLALALPTAAELEGVAQLYEGIHAACARLGALILGGDTTVGSSELVLTVTVIGEIADPEHVCPRSGARPGDLLCVTGPLGVAAAGLLALQRGAEGGAIAKARHRSPQCRLDCVPALAPWATSMIDVSDGLASEVHHLCRASRVGAVVDVGAVPLLPEAIEIAGRYGVDPLSLALSGGDDYELLYTLDPAERNRVIGVVIGEVTASLEVRLKRGDRLEPLPNTGYDHFRAPEGSGAIRRDP